MYHLELRQFPHNACHFNLSESELWTIAIPWACEQWVEVGERKWNPHQAKLKILEGPEMPLDQLTMGRGWRLAEREGADVTERVLQAARTQVAAGGKGDAPRTAQADAIVADQGQGAGQGVAADAALLADSLGLELLAALDEAPVALVEVWRLAAERLAQRPASESLALAERAVASLLRRRMVVLVTIGEGDAERIVGGEIGGTVADGTVGGRADGGDGAGGEGAPADDQIAASLYTVDSWRLQDGSGALGLRRA